MPDEIRCAICGRQHETTLHVWWAYELRQEPARAQDQSASEPVRGQERASEPVSGSPGTVG